MQQGWQEECCSPSPGPCEGPALLRGFALTPSPTEKYHRRACSKECFLPAFPAWASFFCLGMRKLGTTFLYDTEPSWGLGTSTWVLLAAEYENLLASTYLSIYHNTRASSESEWRSLSPGSSDTKIFINLPAVTQGDNCGVGV